MKKTKLTLTLNKETVASLNNSEMNDIQGGKSDTQLTLYCVKTWTCPSNLTSQQMQVCCC